jgi:NhaP-type Na+/H+ or K+/H+ antiporter
VTFFESLLALLLAAVILLQVSRRLTLPYPAMLAGAGVLVALVPGSPTITLDPETALALFIAPALLDAAYDFPIGAAARLWRPLVMLAVVAVLLTTSLVAWVGWAWAGLPLAAAVALGAIVAPPDAAAATAVIGAVSVPRSSAAVLKGESLFNDATALILFGEAVAVQANGKLTGSSLFELVAAGPGGVLLGIGFALVARRVNRYVTGTLGGNILQFVNAFLAWLVAEHLHLSAVLCVVAFAMTIARDESARGEPRMRIQSYAVWSMAVFLLNVLAFLLMGMQAKVILARMPTSELGSALGFAGLVVAVVVAARFAVVLGYTAVARRWRWARGEAEVPTWRQSVLVSWSGMRGLVTLATAFALPPNFPQRDLVVLTAFCVVLATLVIQGLTLAPAIRRLGLNSEDELNRELSDARTRLRSAALATVKDIDGAEAGHLRFFYRIERKAADDPEVPSFKRYRELGLAAVCAERDMLAQMRRDHRIGADTFNALEEELDWRELTLLPEDARQIEES